MGTLILETKTVRKIDVAAIVTGGVRITLTEDRAGQNLNAMQIGGAQMGLGPPPFQTMTTALTVAQARELIAEIRSVVGPSPPVPKPASPPKKSRR